MEITKKSTVRPIILLEIPLHTKLLFSLTVIELFTSTLVAKRREEESKITVRSPQSAWVPVHRTYALRHLLPPTYISHMHSYYQFRTPIRKNPLELDTGHSNHNAFSAESIRIEKNSLDHSHTVKSNLRRDTRWRDELTEHTKPSLFINHCKITVQKIRSAAVAKIERNFLRIQFQTAIT